MKYKCKHCNFSSNNKKRVKEHEIEDHKDFPYIGFKCGCSGL